MKKLCLGNLLIGFNFIGCALSIMTMLVTRFTNIAMYYIACVVMIITGLLYLLLISIKYSK